MATNGPQKLIEEVEEFLKILPPADNSLEEQFRESVQLLCMAFKKSPPDENGQFVPPDFIGT